MRLGLLILATLAIAFGATLLGTISIDGLSAWRQYFGLPQAQWHADTHILALRIPRVVLAGLAGGALAVSGAVMQTLLRNSLATPYTLGVATAGSFGAFLTFAIPSLAIFGSRSQIAYSLLASILCLLLVQRISQHSRRADGLLLAGITLNFLFGSLVLLVRYIADPFQLAAMERWVMGSLNAVQMETALAPLPWILAGLAVLGVQIRSLDLLAFDEEVAAARGVPVKRAKTSLLLGAGLLAASVVAYTGPIGFIGLLVPHAVRWMTGLRHGMLIPSCFFCGGSFLIVADLFARTLELGGRNSELPVGIVTALVGAPFFLALLIKGR